MKKYILILIFSCFLLTNLMAQTKILSSKSNLPVYSSTESSGECYCHFYVDYNNYINYIDNIIQAQRNAWFNNQKQLLKSEIENRLNNQFNSFEDAQRAFFKQFSTDAIEDYKLNQIKNTELASSDAVYPQFLNTYSERKIFQYAQSNSQWDFGGLVYNNKSLESMTFSEAQNLFNQFNTENLYKELDWEDHHNRAIRSNWVNQNDLFSDFLVDQYVNNVNSHSLEDRVTLMTGYLIYDAQDYPLIVVPPTEFGGVPFYFPYNYDYTANINNFIDNSTLPWENITNPSWTFEQIKEKYSTQNGHLGNLVANYLKNDKNLQDKVGSYQGQHGYDPKSKTLVKKFIESYANDDPFVSDSYFHGPISWWQNSLNPEKIMHVNLSGTAQNYGFVGFGKVMEAMSLFTTEYSKEGSMIKKLITQNSNFTFPSSLSDVDLGKLFDFYDEGDYFLGIKFSPFAMQHIINIETWDNVYGWSMFTNSLKTQLLLNIVKGDDVDFNIEPCPEGKVRNSDNECVTPCDTSKEDLKNLFPNASDANMNTLANVINLYGKDFGIDTKEKLQHFLAQAGHETGGFTTLQVTEGLNYSTASLIPKRYSKFTMDTIANPTKLYAGNYTGNAEKLAKAAYCCKYGNGNEASGDGWNYRGRGIFQLTWKDNYQKFKTFYNNKYSPDKDFVANPDLISTNDTLAILSGLWYYKTRVLDKISIDSTTTVDKVTKPINSAKAGLKDRKERFQKAKDSIKCK